MTGASGQSAPDRRDAALEDGAAPVPAAAVAAVLAARHHLAGTLEPLPGERDQNFRMHLADGTSVVLKIAHPAEDPAVLAMRAAALRHLAAACPDLPVPRVVPTAAGDPLVEVEGTGRLLLVLTWLDGLPQHLSVPSLAQAAAVGRTLARLDGGFAGFEHPSARHPLLWDLARAGDLRDRLHHVAPERRAVLARVLDRFAAEVRPRLPALRHQVVHNDFNPHNILVDPERPERVAGIIDFGDVVHAALVADLAISASYAMRLPDGEEAAAAMVAGYVGMQPLTEEEIAVLPDLVAVRLAMSVIIAEWRASAHPGNSRYLLRNHAGALAGLDRLASLPAGGLAERFRRAAGREGLE